MLSKFIFEDFIGIAHISFVDECLGDYALIEVSNTRRIRVVPITE